MHFQNDLTRSLNIRFPLIVAPMFLVTNEEMLKASMEAGIMGCFPSLNYRTEGQLDEVLKSLNKFLSARAGQPGTYAVNLIVQKSNPWFEKHLKICIDNKVPVFITSLGNPKTTIEAAHAYGGKVFCDVTNLVHAQKCFDMGCDGFIAVGQGAGGHAGPYPLAILIETLKNAFPDKPVLAAGGIANGKSILSVLAAGASAAYCGTRFIATPEAGVSQEYKNATEFAKKIGTKQNWFERWMSNNPRTKKYFKMLIQRRGFNWLEDAVKPGNYHSLWCAGQSVELIHEIKPVKEIVDEFIRETEIAYEELKKMTT